MTRLETLMHLVVEGAKEMFELQEVVLDDSTFEQIIAEAWNQIDHVRNRYRVHDRFYGYGGQIPLKNISEVTINTCVGPLIVRRGKTS